MLEQVPRFETRMNIQRACVNVHPSIDSQDQTVLSEGWTIVTHGWVVLTKCLVEIRREHHLQRPSLRVSLASDIDLHTIPLTAFMTAQSLRSMERTELHQVNLTVLPPITITLISHCSSPRCDCVWYSCFFFPWRGFMRSDIVDFQGSF